MSQENKEDAVVSPAVCAAVLPPETLDEFKSQLSKDTALYGGCFSSSEELEYFSMLPVQPAVKKQVLLRALELEREKREMPVSER